MLTPFSVEQLYAVNNEFLLAGIEQSVGFVLYDRDIAGNLVCQDRNSKSRGLQKAICETFGLRVVDNDIGLSHGTCHRFAGNGPKVVSPRACFKG